jgi:hypothetical protein
VRAEHRPELDQQERQQQRLRVRGIVANPQAAVPKRAMSSRQLPVELALAQATGSGFRADRISLASPESFVAAIRRNQAMRSNQHR